MFNRQRHGSGPERSVVLIVLVDRLPVADGAPARGLRLGFALFPNRRPAFFLSRSNRRPTRSGDAFALARIFWLVGLSLGLRRFSFSVPPNTSSSAR
jgi:hypothetical protein